MRIRNWTRSLGSMVLLYHGFALALVLTAGACSSDSAEREDDSGDSEGGTVIVNPTEYNAALTFACGDEPGVSLIIPTGETIRIEQQMMLPAEGSCVYRGGLSHPRTHVELYVSGAVVVDRTAGESPRPIRKIIIGVGEAWGVLGESDTPR